MSLLHTAWKTSFTVVIVMLLVTVLLFVVGNISQTTGNDGTAFGANFLGALMLILTGVSSPILLIIGAVSFVLDKLLNRDEANKVQKIVSPPTYQPRPPNNSSQDGGKKR